jgi:ABC-type multidrug transport system ATPase subunit
MLKLPSNMTKEEKLHQVESTLRMLGLTPVADTRIGDAENRGISGGEKKRVSIGILLKKYFTLIF